MFETIKDGLRSFFKSRLVIASFVMITLFSILLWRMFYLQVVSGAQYQDNYTLKIIKERTLGSTRGNIYDRNGKLLAYNELAYSITIEDSGVYSSDSAKNKALNAEIAQVITALEQNGDSIINEFRIDLNAGGYAYNVTGTSLKRFLADVYGESSYDDLNYDDKLGYNPAEATEEQVMEYLSEKRYEISGEYDRSMAYKITVVRFAMSQNAFQRYIVTTIATNVSEESVVYISEHTDELLGVEVVDDTIRRYNDSIYFSSILGYTGKISSEEYAKLSAEDDSYTLNDVIGKGGIEQYMDSVLKGTSGYEKLYVDHMGRVLQVIDYEEPSSGGNVYVSIDADLQIAVYNLLEQEIAGIVYSNIDNGASDIPIPITDVYYALIYNNVIDFEEFEAADASPAERDVQDIFSARQETVKNRLNGELNGPAPTDFNQMSDEDQDYFTYIINRLKRTGILMESSIDTSDDVFQEWGEGGISPQTYLNHAIAQNWIDITQFTVDEKYADSTEIYDALCTHILEEIFYERDFSKLIYEYLIKGEAISGRQLCLILFDQGILSYDDEAIAGLESGSIPAASFLKERIKNLDITPAQLALDPCAGSCVVTDVRTGEVLALVSYPGYDGNRLANTVDAEYFDSLQKDKSLPQYNYATQQSTAPGSTYKMVVAAAGLSEGYITIGERIRDLGEYENISNKPKCWIYPSSHGEINVSEALRDSCNYFFYETGFRMSTANYSTSYNAELGTSVLSEYASMFGLDETTGIEIVENSPRIADDFPVMAAIGQSNNNFTTVQLARYVTAVANSGNVYKYTLLSRVEDAEGNVLQTYEPQIRNTVDALDASEWNAIHSGMRMVVENAREFKEFPITAAGKTGTAQENPKRPNHALFVGYAPYENPEISIATRIAFGYTSHNAAELSRNVFAYYFKVEDTDALLNGQAEDVDSSSNAFND